MGEDTDCCTSNSPCEEKDGHCNNDGDCKDALVCGTDNCQFVGSFDFETGDDCCRQPIVLHQQI